ncbi:hypothetical protein, partial [Rhizobium ecuadorense]
AYPTAWELSYETFGTNDMDGNKSREQLEADLRKVHDAFDKWYRAASGGYLGRALRGSHRSSPFVRHHQPNDWPKG